MFLVCFVVGFGDGAVLAAAVFAVAAVHIFVAVVVAVGVIAFAVLNLDVLA